ncbi:cysteine hydrolase [Ruminococcaceae bacterium OttesenSCG-928-I18]|nr:cysteine hydrolase [Ruminococcaceae bacterium OttesenSCG-928-I18]
MKKLLVVVDYQNDFVVGALGFEGADQLEPGILSEVETVLEQGGFVLFTRDTHPQTYLETREGKHLPIEHCIAETKGHALFGRLHRYEENPVPHVSVIDKPTFGSPDIAEKARELCGGEPDQIALCGLVTDICVIANAIILHSHFPLAEVSVIESLVGSGNEENAGASLRILQGMGIEVRG